MKTLHSLRVVFSATLSLSLASCATLTNDPMTPISLSFSDNSNGKCLLTNKRGQWEATLPSVTSVRRSDDVLKFDCKTEDGRQAVGVIPSSIGGKIIASAVFLDFGITDSITDKHREYPASFVVPVKSPTGKKH